MRSLLVVGDGLPEVAQRVRGGGWEVVAACSGPRELAAILGAARDGSIERLDLCDHGGPGFLTLGGHVLFQSDRDPDSPLVNAALAVDLRRKLTPAAQVRLLGCETGGTWRRRREGRLLLLKLARLLNEGASPRAHRIVFGTITGVEATDFDEQGLRSESALTLLFSSSAALDQEAPAYDARLGSVAQLLGEAAIPADSAASEEIGAAVMPAAPRTPTPSAELVQRFIGHFFRVQPRSQRLIRTLT